MNRWNLLLLTLCLLLAPAVSASGHEPNGNAYGYGQNHGGGDSEGSSSTTVAGIQMVQERCILYEWAGGVEDARVEVTPILGILVLSPMDCVEKILDVENMTGP